MRHCSIVERFSSVRWAGLLAALAAAPAPAGEAPARPNIVLVMPDDVGYGDFGCHGNPIIKTPVVDAFWKESVRFTDFHVSPTCAPTRAALMTGRHEFKNGVTHTVFERERLTLGATTIAQALRSAGYATGVFGKWHLGDEAAYRPDRRGFDESFVHGAGGIGQTYPGSGGDAPGNSYFDPAILHNGKFVKTEGYCTDVFFRQAIAWMDSRRGSGAPFFAYITPNAAHEPLDVPDEYYLRYKDAVPEKAARFFGMIENIDLNFGALLAKLGEWGIADRTLVIFMTDNGGTNGVRVHNAGMRGSKGTQYQGGTRVPSFWRWPAAFTGGLDCGALAAHIDIFPTLAEIAGVALAGEVARQVEGRSLVPLLRDVRAPWADRFLVTHVGRWGWGRAAESKHVNCAIRDSRFSLVNNAELYDLASDPGQATNAIGAHPDVVAALRAAYDEWWAAVLPMLVNEEKLGPPINPFKELYWRQFGGGPDEALLRRMDPEGARTGGAAKKQAAAAPAAGGAARQRPNILYIMSDDHAAHAVSAYGSRINKTPHIDRLAAEGIRFDRCYAVNSICTPSRAAILTGKYSHKNGVPVFNRFDGSQPTVAKYLQAAGYFTGMFGKWHLGSDPTGFDRWMILPGQGAYHNPMLYSAEGRVDFEGYVTDIITDLTIEFLDERPKDRPFFVMCHHKAPHRNWQPDAKHAAMYGGGDVPEPATLRDTYEGRASAARQTTMTVARHLTRNDLKLVPPPELQGAERERWLGAAPMEVTVDVNGVPTTLTGDALLKWKYQRYMQDYLGCVASVDDNVGRLLEYLERNDLAGNTIVVYTSDQGFFLGDHGWYDKRFMYEESIKMPFLVRWPGTAGPGAVQGAIALNVDIAPTFLEAAGLPIPPDIQGRSLVPLCRGERPAGWRKSWYYRYYHDPGHHNTRAHYGAGTETHKLLCFWKTDEWELYDLVKDPEELRNVYGDPAYAETVAALKAELLKLKAEVGDDDMFAQEQPPGGVDGVPESAKKKAPAAKAARKGKAEKDA